MLSLTGRLPTTLVSSIVAERSAPLAEDSFASPAPLLRGLTREQIIDRVLALNPSASVEFLNGFDDRALAEYLEHLNTASQPRGRSARWVRPSGSCGISWSERRN